MKMIESIARKMCESLAVCECTDGYADPVCHKEEFLGFAKAALEALLTPSPVMISAASSALKNYIDRLPPEVRAKSKEKGGVIFVGPLEKHEVRFKAMIKAALEE